MAFSTNIMASSISVGVVGATGNTGKTVVDGLLSTQVNFVRGLQHFKLDS